MKTPDEIKKGLECCLLEGNCNDCPYYHEKCIDSLLHDALTNIQQLEDELEEERIHHQHTLECARQFEAEWASMKRERDAAIRDMKYAERCESCKFYHVKTCKPPCNNCGRIVSGGTDEWEWRGLCAENGGKTDD